MTGKVLDKCPKCSSRITNEIECENCGIIFEKYFQAETRKQARAGLVTVEAAGSSKRSIAIVAGIFIITAFAASLYFGGRSHVSPEPAAVGIP
ncbi:MAG TPA: hypothetical protein PLM29_13710, partial [Deltaproteobacteria bacterium]|nr:hypothetical protein [Deltaproteobacteria bacterium]